MRSLYRTIRHKRNRFQTTRVQTFPDKSPPIYNRISSLQNSVRFRYKINTRNVEINDVLTLKAARLDASANLQCFMAPGHQRPNFDGCIYIHYAAPPYSAHIKIWLSPFADLHG